MAATVAASFTGWRWALNRDDSRPWWIGHRLPVVHPDDGHPLCSVCGTHACKPACRDGHPWRNRISFGFAPGMWVHAHRGRCSW